MKLRIRKPQPIKIFLDMQNRTINPAYLSLGELARINKWIERVIQWKIQLEEEER